MYNRNVGDAGLRPLQITDQKEKINDKENYNNYVTTITKPNSILKTVQRYNFNGTSG